MRDDHTPTAARLRLIRGARIGVRTGALLTGLALVGVFATGAYRSPHAVAASLIIAVLYLAGGAVAGGIIGLLLPITHRPAGLFAAVTLAATPLFAALFYALLGFSWTTGTTILLLITAPSFALTSTVAWFMLGGTRRRL